MRNPKDIIPIQGQADERPFMPPIGELNPDWRDLECRVADLEDRQRRQDQEAAAKMRLRQLGLVFPGDKQ